MPVIGYDLDGVLSLVKPTSDIKRELFPVPEGSVCISGRTFAEYDDLCKKVALKMPLYIRGVGAYGDRQAAAEFKVMMIRHLNVTLFLEDDLYQAAHIRRYTDCEVRVVRT